MVSRPASVIGLRGMAASQEAYGIRFGFSGTNITSPTYCSSEGSTFR